MPVVAPVVFETPALSLDNRIEEEDQLLRRNAEQLLRRSSYHPLRRLECRVADGIVELCGSVPSFFLKQMAQSTILRIDDLKGVRNSLFIAAAN